jgi:hypothetical protein
MARQLRALRRKGEKNGERGEKAEVGGATGKILNFVAQRDETNLWIECEMLLWGQLDEIDD